jgi:outer membrane protein OmpA-like peptidoglycan-associated protein
MLRTILLLLAISSCALVNAQDVKKPAATASNIAKVDVNVTDMQGKASKGEVIIFKAETKGKFYSGRSDAKGKFSIQLPAGDKYMISVKSLADSTQYGVLEIPALEADQFFTEPFVVDIQFEPARSYTLDDVHFDVGKASLRPGSTAELEDIVSYMKNKETTSIEIAGHTDNVGKDADNIKLSQQRAETIRSYLIKKGIQAARVIAKGYGATEPIADNATEEGRQLNRRTEVRLL